MVDLIHIPRRGIKPPFIYTQRYGLVRGHPHNNNLLACWLFNEGAGNLAVDLSGNQHHGTMSTSPVWVGRESGIALDFEAGSSNLISLPQLLTLTGNNTVSIWLTFESNRNYHMFLGDTSNDNYFYMDNSGGTQHFRLQDDASQDRAFGDFTPVLGQLYHAIFVQTNTTEWQLYIDGVYHSSVSFTNGTLKIDMIGYGYSSGDYYHDGIIEEVCIWGDRAFSAEEAQDLYANRFDGVWHERGWANVVVVGGITVAPSPAFSIGGKVDPQTVLGSISYTPNPTTAIGANVDPTIELGSLSLTPNPTASVAGKVDPIAVLGSLSIAPATTMAIGVTVDPTVDIGGGGGILVVPSPVSAVAGTVNPTIVLSALSITPSPTTAIGERVNPIVVLGGLSLTPSPTTSVGVTIDPTVTLGSILIVPVAASAVATIVDPSLILGTIAITPTSTAVVVDTVDPVVLAGIPALSIASEVAVITVDTRRRTIAIDTDQRLILANTDPRIITKH